MLTVSGNLSTFWIWIQWNLIKTLLFLVSTAIYHFKRISISFSLEYFASISSTIAKYGKYDIFIADEMNEYAPLHWCEATVPLLPSNPFSVIGGVYDLF